MTLQMTGAEMAVIRALADQGAEHVFGYPGGAVLPIYAELVPCLVHTDGTLLSTRDVRTRALTGRLVPEQLEREIEAQVRSVLDAGVPVSHVDSHRHLHKFAQVRAALASVLPRLEIRRVRAVQDLYVSRPLLSPTYWLGRRWRASIRRRSRRPSTSRCLRSRKTPGARRSPA